MLAQSASDLGRIVAAARKHRGLTQEQLARAVGASQNWISEVEAGKPTAQVGKVLSVLAFLGVRLQVSEAPWLTAQATPKSPEKPSRAPRVLKVTLDDFISLDDIVDAHSVPPPRRSRKRSRR